jgi:hypothetical protein
MTLPSDTYFKNGVNILVFIGHMQRNFILTDIMKTGSHVDLEDFISMHSLDNHKFDMTGEYYTLHNYDLDSYDRRFAIIDVSYKNARLQGNQQFMDDLQARCSLLQSQGFVFIQATPWESQDNIQGSGPLPHIDIEHIKWTGGVSWFWFYMYRKHVNNTLSFTHTEKQFDMLYLNKMNRPHRQSMFDEISKTDLLENSLYTRWPEKKLPSEYELPWAQNYPLYGMDQDIYEKPYNATKFSLVSETNDNSTEVFITEKLWKAIIAEHIFVVHGNYLYLQKLREIGFKTFGNYIDESYDLESDPHKRIHKIVSTCQQLKKGNWQDLYLQTQGLRKHNYNMLFNKEKLSNQINKTLELFLEFADSGQVSS